ncbi:hypothetical protein QCD83_20800 [Pseudomonas savastanoi pv. phaseolicola]|uniref:hypothetical protein n=1 Tax=Pseudomonas savastanoi TaxID=29438 RepID=UPI000E312CDF|nr:hypothetical protein [Pseudomonas savastanoi]MDG6381302.1 hypothetical protein [Pseudomonas savastanoi pv. phaseolicola]
MAAVLNSIIRYKARKLALAHIKRALESLRDSSPFDFQDCQREINDNYWRRKSVNFMFSNAYEGPWYKLGQDDALEGRKRFDVPAYVEGWRNEILSLSFNGWLNPHIIQQYGWIDGAVGNEYLILKHQIDQLDWDAARQPSPGLKNRGKASRWGRYSAPGSVPFGC